MSIGHECLSYEKRSKYGAGFDDRSRVAAPLLVSIAFAALPPGC
jgi:hypothetical protein